MRKTASQIADSVIQKISSEYQEGESLFADYGQRKGDFAAPMFGGIGAGLTAPEGEGFKRYLGTQLGGAGGILAGALGGGAAGAGLGAGIGALLRNPGAGALIGGVAGSSLGSMGGAGLGAAAGNRMAARIAARNRLAEAAKE